MKRGVYNVVPEDLSSYFVICPTILPLYVDYYDALAYSVAMSKRWHRTFNVVREYVVFDEEDEDLMDNSSSVYRLVKSKIGKRINRTTWFFETKKFGKSMGCVPQMGRIIQPTLYDMSMYDNRPMYERDKLVERCKDNRNYYRGIHGETILAVSDDDNNTEYFMYGQAFAKSSASDGNLLRVYPKYMKK